VALAPADLSLGRRLYSQRAGLDETVEQAAAETRIRADFIRKLESDDLDFLAPVYVRGHLESYARHLGLDPGPLLADFDSTHQAHDDVLQVVHTEYDVGPHRIGLRTVAGLTLVVLVGLGLWNPGGGDSERLPVSATKPADTATRSDRDPAQGGDADQDLPGAVLPHAVAGDREAPDSGGRAISFTNGIDSRLAAATGPCWVEVVADGRVVYRGMMEPGTIKRFRAKGDMQLLLGLPRSAELVVNGKRLRLPKLATPIRIALPSQARRYL
jgi:cytoskeleton protein RodZ